ncbi:MAG TPA: hypothetical protein PLI13_02080, partial [Paracoccus sp. (in: a-proteobacteria)]|nr:hypothetical protein [Paracoccus sp. (in: a-proteobacteria)]
SWPNGCAPMNVILTKAHSGCARSHEICITKADPVIATHDVRNLPAASHFPQEEYLDQQADCRTHEKRPR